MTTASKLRPESVLRAYYAGTVLFLLLDFGLDINVRVAFLEDWPGWRAAYYLFCFACLGLMAWRPAWSAVIGIAESLVTLSGLIINMALRVVIVTDEMIESGRGAVTWAEIGNFLIASAIVYLGYLQGMDALRGGAGTGIR